MVAIAAKALDKTEASTAVLALPAVPANLMSAIATATAIATSPPMTT
jgi:hypothetical protein